MLLFKELPLYKCFKLTNKKKTLQGTKFQVSQSLRFLFQLLVIVARLELKIEVPNVCKSYLHCFI